MATNPQERVLELLKRFNDGQKVCIEALKNDVLWESKSEKTIRRDLDVIKKHFDSSFELIPGGKGEKGCYKAITKDIFSNFMDKDTIALMVQTFNIAQRSNVLESLNINDADKRIIESKIKKSKDCYEFITKPYETKKNDIHLLKEIERAIYGRRYTSIVHKEGNKKVEYFLKPYKIVFMNENFYLVCENIDEKHPFSIFRIINIESIVLDSKTFHLNPDIEDFIKYLQTPFPKYTPSFRKHLVEVVVEIDPVKAKYFKVKKHLPSQKEIETQEDGTLVLSFTVTQEMEMDDLVKKWIPHMRVISPLSLKEKIEDDLKQYLNI